MLGRIVFVALLFGGPSASTLAQGDCPPLPRGPYETTPISGSTGVARNAVVRARYPEGHLDVYAESISVFDEDGAPVPGTLEVVGSDTLFFTPDDVLRRNSSYTLVATGVDNSIEASFRTGSAWDRVPPSAPQIVDAEAGEASATCAQPEGGVRLSFLFVTSDDDAGVASLQYSLYRTRGPDIDAPTMLARVAQEVFVGETQSVGAVLTERESAGVSCFVIVAEDGLFQTTPSDEFCFEPGVGVIFDSLCSTSDPRGAARSLAPTMLLLVAALWRGRRRSAA
jgi:hypothetical protein